MGLTAGWNERTDTPTPIPTQSKLGPAAPVTYDNRYEIYGGLNFMNFHGRTESAEADEHGRRRSFWGRTG